MMGSRTDHIGVEVGAGRVAMGIHSSFFALTPLLKLKGAAFISYSASHPPNKI